jgi:hypothetical protein
VKPKERRENIMKILTIDSNRYVLPTDMAAKDIQALAGFLVTLTKVDYEWMYGQQESLYFANEGAKVSIDQMDLVSKEEAKTRAATARDVYQAKKDEEERAKAGDLVGLHVNQ